MLELNDKKLSAAVKYINSWLEFNFDNSNYPGLSVAIQHGSKPVYSKAFGFADKDKKTRLTTKHTFRIASHSKTFTAIAIMQLQEQGKLQIDDAVSKYLPWFKSSLDKRVSKVTIRQLMNHTAGLTRDGNDSNYWQLTREFPNEGELKDFVKDSYLYYKPDEKFKYSNYGPSYLGMVIEAVSGEPYRSYVTKHIIEKLKLKSTGPDIDQIALETLAVGYGVELFHRKPVSFGHPDTNAMSPATGFYATPTELCEYFSAHFYGDRRLIKDSTKKEMQEGYRKVGGSRERYGLGLANYSIKGWKVFGHGGGFPGFTSRTEFDPQLKLVASVFVNSSDAIPGRICTSLIEIIDAFQQDTKNTKGSVNPEKFAGRFYSSWGPHDIIPVGNKLLLLELMHWNSIKNCEKLKIVDDKTLKITKAEGYSSPGEYIEYTFDAKGKAKHINYAGRTMFPLEIAKTKGWF